MTTTETLLAAIHEHATADELRPITYFLGECVAKRETQTLERFHDRLRKLRRAAAPGSWHRGFADAVTAYLDGYFATVESAQRLESLAREVEAQPLWREILATLQGDRELNQVSIGSALTARAAEVPTSKTAISLALEDLRDRELVEYVPSEARRERVHALTRRGRALCASLSLAPGAAMMKKPAPAKRAAAAPKSAPAASAGTRKVPARSPAGDV